MCKFSGLSNFPFDTLRCQIEFGGWLMSGGHQVRLTLTRETCRHITAALPLIRS